MGTEIVTAPQTQEQWKAAKQLEASQIAALDGQRAARRGAELIAILEVASKKIDRFGWDKMDDDDPIKVTLTNDWCDVLVKYTMQEVRDGVAAVFEASGGKIRSINEYQVQAQIKAARHIEFQGLPKQAPAPEQPIERVTPEQKEAIFKAAGMRVDETGKIMS